MVDLDTPHSDACVSDPAMTRHHEELIAELRDRGATPCPSNVLHYALELGLSESTATNLATMFERRLRSGRP